MTVFDVQRAVAEFARSEGRQPRAVVSNQKTHDDIVKSLRTKPAQHQLQKWRINNSLADDQIGFD